MKQNINSIIGQSVRAINGDIGKVSDFIFNDQTWTIHYLVVNTGKWLFDREVLISPLALGQYDRKSLKLVVNLTRKQVFSSPDIDIHMPLSRQNERRLFDYYSWPSYWNNEYFPLEGRGVLDEEINKTKEIKETKESKETKPEDSHLRSVNAITGYSIHAIDGNIGHIKDFVVDDENWNILHLVAAAYSWWSRKNVLIPIRRVRKINLEDEEFLLDLNRATVMNGPEYEYSKLSNTEIGEVKVGGTEYKKASTRSQSHLFTL
ncbi:MAG: PRC-barrel domain-containing protein [Oligoflexia bacterium]|nr:PRC-barrel domain-containing protein [Oligoflexia bacterium]